MVVTSQAHLSGRLGPQAASLHPYVAELQNVAQEEQVGWLALDGSAAGRECVVVVDEDQRASLLFNPQRHCHCFFILVSCDQDVMV